MSGFVSYTQGRYTAENSHHNAVFDDIGQRRVVNIVPRSFPPSEKPLCDVKTVCNIFFTSCRHWQIRTFVKAERNLPCRGIFDKSQ